jgi:hypothetical protein
MPKRIQMTRQRPWRADNPDAVIVARPSKWGNPIDWKPPLDRRYATHTYSLWITGCEIHGDIRCARPSLCDIRRELMGRDLACWCPLDQPCHADVLLRLANQPD